MEINRLTLKAVKMVVDYFDGPYVASASIYYRGKRVGVYQESQSGGGTVSF